MREMLTSRRRALNRCSAESTSSEPSSDVTYGASTRNTRANVKATFERIDLVLLDDKLKLHIEQQLA